MVQRFPSSSVRLLLACACLGACDSSGSGPKVTADVSPEGSDVDPKEVVYVRFSEGVDPATVSPGSFVVSRGGVVVEGRIQALAADDFEFRPSHPDGFALLGEHQVELTSAIRSLDGSKRLDGLTASFVVRDGSWSEAQTVDSVATESVRAPHLFLFDDGVAAALWVRRPIVAGFTSSIASTRFDPRLDSWKAPTMLTTQAEVQVDGVELDSGASADGWLIAAWVDRRDLVARRHAPQAEAWGARELIARAETDDVQLRAAALPAGAAVAVWAERAESGATIHASTSIVPGAWEPRQRLGSREGVEDLRLGSIAVDPETGAAAIALAVRTRDVPVAKVVVQVARFEPLTGIWSKPEEVLAVPDRGTAPEIPALVQLAEGELALSWVDADASGTGEHRFSIFDGEKWIERASAGVLGRSQDVSRAADGSLYGAWFADHPASRLQIERFDRDAERWELLSEVGHAVSDGAPTGFDLRATREGAGFVVWSEATALGGSVLVWRFDGGVLRPTSESYTGTSFGLGVDADGRASLIAGTQRAGRSETLVRHFR